MIHEPDFSTPAGKFRLVRRKDLISPEMAAYLVGANLQRWLTDPLELPFLIDLAREVNGRSDSAGGAVPSWDLNHRLRPYLEEAFRRGELVLLRVSPTRGNGGQEGEEEARRSAPHPHPQQEVRKTWVEIQLVDDQGVTVPNERCRIELPDGTMFEGVTDARGVVRVDGIDPGTCEVNFPDLDLHEWEAA